MRLLLTALLVTTLGASALAFSHRQQNASLQQQINALNEQAEQLLDELDQNTRRRLADETRAAQLTEEIASSREQIRTLSQQMDQVRQRIDPDFEQLEQRIRQRLESDYQRRLTAATEEIRNQPASVASVISQLGDLSNQERMALIRVQGQYGNFLDTLDADAERKTRITEALVDLNLSQAQVREDLLSQGLEPQELANQMMALMSPEATRDTLSYDLTDEELAAFDAFQEQRQSTFMAGAVGDGGVFMIRREGSDAANLIERDGDIIINTDTDSGQTRRLIIQGATPAGPAQ
jgi:chromosome segregation ATPase